MASGFGELILVLGDLHIPQRAVAVHEKFRSILAICTGNTCTSEQVEWIRTLAPRLHLVKGDADTDESLPETRVLTVADFRIGVCHGHQVSPWGDPLALAALARKLDVDVLVSGHTHVSDIVEYEGRCFVNPGSITGAYSPQAGIGAVVPSFTLMSIQPGRIEFFLYELAAPEGGAAGAPLELRIARSAFSKGAATAGSGASPVKLPASGSFARDAAPEEGAA